MIGRHDFVKEIFPEPRLGIEFLHVYTHLRTTDLKYEYVNSNGWKECFGQRGPYVKGPEAKSSMGSPKDRKNLGGLMHRARTERDNMWLRASRGQLTFWVLPYIPGYHAQAYIFAVLKCIVLYTS